MESALPALPRLRCRLHGAAPSRSEVAYSDELFPECGALHETPRLLIVPTARARTRVVSFVVLARPVRPRVMSGSAGSSRPFRSGAQHASRVYTTVTDFDRTSGPSLTKDDFEIYDNGKLQPITLFATETQPISIAIMLDRSGSMKDKLPLVAAGAEEFVERLLPPDKARIGSFATKIQLDPEEFTSDRKTLIDILRGELQPEGPTPLWNAANVADGRAAAQDGRKVVLLFTDGVDSPGNFKTNNLSVMDVMERATKDDVMLYAIGLESRMPYGRRQSPLGRRRFRWRLWRAVAAAE